ncbi:MAG TPA: glycosyltransferase, partial [Fervidobacterium sp.]|nr:glycosyltransferase [Fervidobacterium sp.]
MIKVLHAIDGRAWGGAERVVAMLASGLQKRGNSVSVWTSKRGGCAPIFREKLGEGVEIKELPLLNDADIVSIAHFWYALRKYDIVHLHLSHAAVLCAVALAISPNHYSRKVICHFHGLIANPKHYRAYTQGV